jgi:hydroxymethylpyrimidine kinase/phosphomethylpyrimidine kinase
MMPRVLIIAGSDSGGGAGIQADLKTVTLLGGWGMTAVTALTAQNTQGVQAIHEVPPAFIAQQIDAVARDIGVDAVKIGMLLHPSTVQTVARKIRQYRFPKVVLDPVMTAKGGVRLLSSEAEKTLIQELFPLATLITPNLPESEALTGRSVRDPKGMRAAALRLHRMGARNVLIKGGHLDGDPIDLLFDGKNFLELKGRRWKTPHTHGTGCTMASAIAVEWAKGQSLRDAVEVAKSFVSFAIRAARPLGHGNGPIDPFSFTARELERYRIIQKLKEGFLTLQKKKIGNLCPEVQSNLGYALPYAQAPEDVAAFPGRIIRIGAEIFKVADPEFGASRHIAEIILTAMAYDQSWRSAMNLRFSPEILARAKDAGLRIAYFNRRNEPLSLKRREGASLSWGIEQALKKSRTRPDIIYDRGDLGKEPMIRVLGRDPQEVVEKVIRLT